MKWSARFSASLVEACSEQHGERQEVPYLLVEAHIQVAASLNSVACCTQGYAELALACAPFTLAIPLMVSGISQMASVMQGNRPHE